MRRHMDGSDWNNDCLCEANLGRHQIFASKKLHKQQRSALGASGRLTLPSFKTGADKNDSAEPREK